MLVWCLLPRNQRALPRRQEWHIPLVWPVVLPHSGDPDKVGMMEPFLLLPGLPPHPDPSALIQVSIRMGVFSHQSD